MCQPTPLFWEVQPHIGDTTIAPQYLPETAAVEIRLMFTVCKSWKKLLICISPNITALAAECSPFGQIRNTMSNRGMGLCLC